MEQPGTRVPANHAGELALAAACRRGDRHAQRQLYDDHKDKMYGLCLRFVDTPEDAEDLLQEGFIRVFLDIGKYRGEGPLEGWVRRVVLHTALQYIKKRKRQDQMLELDLAENLMDPNDGEDDPYEPGRLVRLLQELPPGFRAVLNLYVVEEFSHEEIARELGIAVGTSKSQLQRAKAFLRGLIDKTLVIL